MKEIDVTTRIIEMSYSELTKDHKRLVDSARDATYRSYAPYSHYHVGAAILLDNGDIVTGANQENAAYPSGLCAERTACYYAHASHPQQHFKAIAIAARNSIGEFVEAPVSPCGSCRQALMEYEKIAGEPVTVLLCGRDTIYVVESVSALLPLAFVDFN